MLPHSPFPNTQSPSGPFSSSSAFPAAPSVSPCFCSFRPVVPAHPEGADQSGLSPSPSRIRWEPTCLRGPSRRSCPGSPSGRCRPKALFTVTFSNSLGTDLPQRPLSPALPRLPVRKVPTEAVFLRHLLELVGNGPASEALLAVIAPAPCPEGADRSSLSPSPSRIRYERTCLRGPSRQPYP